MDFFPYFNSVVFERMILQSVKRGDNEKKKRGYLRKNIADFL
jgi:hypothetical protein